MDITLDIAATLSALLWPLVVLAILLAYRSRIPSLVEGLASRIRKVEVPGFSLELAQATPFVPQWSAAPMALDLRHKASAVQINDSTAGTFLAQLATERSGDYAEINLGTGAEWLTSRLFIMAIVFARMKGIECFVFLETAGSTRRRFVGWADPVRIRWALARQYPWLEAAYAEAYAAIFAQPNTRIVSSTGRLGYANSPGEPNVAIELLKAFLQCVQRLPVPPAPPLEADAWVSVDLATGTREHAHWLSAEALEQVLGEDCHKALVFSSELRSQGTAGQLNAIMAVPARFVAVVGNDQRFEYLVRRDVLVEQASRTMLAEPGGCEPERSCAAGETS